MNKIIQQSFAVMLMVSFGQSCEISKNEAQNHFAQYIHSDFAILDPYVKNHDYLFADQEDVSPLLDLAKKALETQGNQVSRRSFEVLWDFGTNQDRDLIRSIFENPDDPRHTKAACAMAFGDHDGKQQAFEYLREQINNPQAIDRYHIARTLLHFGIEADRNQAAPFLVKVLEDPNPLKVFDAAQALCIGYSHALQIFNQMKKEDLKNETTAFDHQQSLMFNAAWDYSSGYNVMISVCLSGIAPSFYYGHFSRNYVAQRLFPYSSYSNLKFRKTYTFNDFSKSAHESLIALLNQTGDTRLTLAVASLLCEVEDPNLTPRIKTILNAVLNNPEENIDLRLKAFDILMNIDQETSKDLTVDFLLNWLDETDDSFSRQKILHTLSFHPLSESILKERILPKLENERENQDFQKLLWVEETIDRIYQYNNLTKTENPPVNPYLIEVLNGNDQRKALRVASIFYYSNEPEKKELALTFLRKAIESEDTHIALSCIEKLAPSQLNEDQTLITEAISKFINIFDDQQVFEMFLNLYRGYTLPKFKDLALNYLSEILKGPNLSRAVKAAKILWYSNEQQYYEKAFKFYNDLLKNSYNYYHAVAQAHLKHPFNWDDEKSLGDRDPDDGDSDDGDSDT